MEPGSATAVDVQSAAVSLAEYAATLRIETLPAAVRDRARDCLIDTVAAAVFGHDLPWSRMIVEYAGGPSSSGNCTILGIRHPGTSAEAAALANGVLAHAAELDSLRQPGAGVHPGAALVPAGLALAQETGASGRDLLVALVAGIEVMFRIGNATHHSCEARGFHAPGLTGPLGAAVVAGRLLKLDAGRMTNALGIAGSLCGGLLEFAKSGDGGMVKRLHLGRAAQSGVLAARLAAAGFTGPASVLDGPFGFLNAYALEHDKAALTAALGRTYETLNICFKRYPCHITAHTAVWAVQALRAAHGIAAGDVVSIEVSGNRKTSALHDIKEPRDLVMAQYSIPFCVAVAFTRDADDPASFGESALHDAAVRDLCRRVTVTGGDHPGWATVTRVALRDGRIVEHAAADYPGVPARPLDSNAVQAKFLSLTRRLGAPAAQRLHARLANIEHETGLAWLGTAASPDEGD
jgi:2-methylcitrate dehydratase PrpD